MTPDIHALEGRGFTALDDKTVKQKISSPASDIGLEISNVAVYLPSHQMVQYPLQ